MAKCVTTSVKYGFSQNKQTENKYMGTFPTEYVQYARNILLGSKTIFWAFYFHSGAHRTAYITQHSSSAACSRSSLSSAATTHIKHRHTIENPQPSTKPSAQRGMNSQLSPFNSSNAGSVEGHPDPARVTQPTASRSNWK